MSAGACHTTRGELVCFRQTASCDETDFKSTEKGSSSFDVAARCVAEFFLLRSSQIFLFRLCRMRSNFFLLPYCHHTFHSFLSFHLSLRMSLSVKPFQVEPCFLVGWRLACSRRSIWGIFHPFSLTGYVYLCLIKQAPHFLMLGPRQEVCWQDVQAWPEESLKV